jgi:hypothetical protein
LPKRSTKKTPQDLIAEAHRLRALILAARQTPDLERQYHLNMEMEQWEAEFEARRQLLLEYESSDLVQEALRWGIDVDPEWHVELIDTDSHTMPQLKQPAWLNETGRMKLRKQIRDARFAYWKGWAEIIIPILALLVAIIALVKR